MKPETAIVVFLVIEALTVAALVYLYWQQQREINVLYTWAHDVDRYIGSDDDGPSEDEDEDIQSEKQQAH